MRALSASLESMSLTPSVCGALSCACPEYRIISPVMRRNWPDWIYLVAAIPSRLMLYLFISIAAMDVFPCSCIVLTFQAAATVCCFGEWRIGLVGSRCCWFSLPGVMRSSDELLSSRHLVFVRWFVCVSVTKKTFTIGGVVSPTLFPQKPIYILYGWFNFPGS